MPEQFEYTEFFCTDQDPGETVTVTMQGRDVPVTFKTFLSNEDIAAARSKSISMKIGEDGKPEISNIDEAAFSDEIGFRSIKDWPFTYKDGSKVSVNRNLYNKLNSDGGMKLSQLAMQRFNSRKAGETPFTNTSGEK